MASREVRVGLRTEADLLAARQQARSAAAGLGFGATEITGIVTAVSELSRNILTYAGRGEIVLSIFDDGRQPGIVVLARDEGPGIADVKKALLDGFSTSGGLGLGLPGARRLMDEFAIESTPGQGTRVTVARWLRRK